jgi:uncharacterized membrane-anchored protein
VRGPARLGRRTKLLTRRLVRGDVAILDHGGLDRVCAQELIAAGVSAVINCRASVSDAYPNLGPLLLVQAGVKLIDAGGDELFSLCADGQPIELRGGEISRDDGVLLARGTELREAALAEALLARRAAIDGALARFAANTLEHMRVERELLTGRLELPVLRTDFRERPALVVARGSGYIEDLDALRSYIARERPVIVAVDGAAEGVLSAGLHPQMIVGDMDSAGDGALASGAELVAHGYLDGRAPGRDRLIALGLPHCVVRMPGTSEDLALLIAAEGGASPIVSVGSQLSLVELLERGRQGAASAFLTRLRVGELLIDARGISRLARLDG